MNLKTLRENITKEEPIVHQNIDEANTTSESVINLKKIISKELEKAGVDSSIIEKSMNSLTNIMTLIINDEVNKAKKEADEVLVSLMNTISSVRTDYVNKNS